MLSVLLKTKQTYRDCMGNDSQSFSNQKLTIVGAGRLGQTLGRLFVQNQIFFVEQVYCRTLTSAEKAADFIGQGRAVDDLRNLSNSEIVCLAVPDDSITQVAQALAEQFVDSPPWGAFHCSGASGAEILAPLENIGVKVAALHPIYSFASPSNAVKEFSGVNFALDGEEQLLGVLERAVLKLQGKSFRIRSEDKALYHTANVILSNLLVALVHQGISLYQEVGVSESDARSIVAPLVNASVNSIALNGTVAALTGPIVRGDHSTVEKHLRALESQSSLVASIYRDLSLTALEIAKLRGEASLPQLERIATLLNNLESTGGLQ